MVVAGFQQRILYHLQRNKAVLQQLLTGAALMGSASVTVLTVSKVHHNGSVHFPPATTTTAASLLSKAKTAGMEQQHAHHQHHPESVTAIHEEDEEGPAAALFYGQCYERQVYKPKLPYPAWDSNWDGREPDVHQQQSSAAASTAAVPVVSDTEEEEEMQDGGKTNQLATSSSTSTSTTNASTVGKTRHILLVRHGQYVQQAADDARRVLTPLGRRQAHATGRRLARMVAANAHHLREHGHGNETSRWAGPCRVRAVHCSTMARARETADIILQHVRQSEQEHYHAQTIQVTEPDPLLNEGLPAAIVPPRPDVGPMHAIAQHVDVNGPRLEAAFQKYFHRADATDDDDDHVHEFEVIVGHANGIRYFFCRALQLPPEAWLRLSLFNCSITYLMVQPNGYVTVRLLGDTGHLPYEETTFSGAYGYNWKSPTST